MEILSFLNIIKDFFFLVGYVTNYNLFPEPLSPDEEEKYLKLYEEGDENSKKVLIERNLRLVAHIAKKYTNSSVDQEDIISIGTIGLIKAVNSYKGNKGVRLATYAARCIENEILMYLRKNNNNRIEVSIDEPLNVDWDGNELLLSDILGTDNDVTQKNIEDETDRELLYLAMEKLSGRERNIVELRFGINNNGDEMTQKEVADLLGISQSYISRLEKRIIKRLRKDMNKMINS